MSLSKITVAERIAGLQNLVILVQSGMKSSGTQS